jgi:chromosome transmission fidelity protein 8
VRDHPSRLANSRLGITFILEVEYCSCKTESVDSVNKKNTLDTGIGEVCCFCEKVTSFKMTEISIYPSARSLAAQGPSPRNPLPVLLQTPSGLALLELQGTINLPAHQIEDATDSIDVNGTGSSQETPIGRLMFPNYHPDTQEPGSKEWMKSVYFYVGKHQRLTGEVKKLPKAIAIIRKRRADDIEGSAATAVMPGDDKPEELEIVEIVKWKILFSQRPEPVGTWNGVP